MTARNILMAAAGGSTAANYIEDVFSTYLYTGNGSTQTINNGIDLAGKGGLVWAKSRSGAAQHVLADTARGTGQILQTSTTNGNTATALNITSFNADGYGLSSYSGSNGSGITYASWTFRKQPKFFDVVTYTGSFSAQNITHSLGSVPGCIIVKRTTGATDWYVYHRGLINSSFAIRLNTTDAQEYTTAWNSTDPTATSFSVGANAALTNAAGQTYVAYLFAHDAGGFGLSGTDNVISCGSFTTDASGNATVNLGYEPQWVLWKRTNGVDSWDVFDTMRGMSQSGMNILYPNTSGAENPVSGAYVFPTATGFQVANGGYYANSTQIYIAIRRGPMKVPTDGTKVFKPVTRAGTGADAAVTGVGFTPDLIMDRYRAAGADTVAYDRLRGISPYMATNLTTAESGFGGSGNISFDMDGVTLGTGAPFNASGNNYINWFFQRAPGFFDEVCYLGNNSGGGQSITHNLTVPPELIIAKNRGVTGGWYVYAAPLGTSSTLQLNSTATPTGGIFNLPASPTSTTFGVRSLVNEDYNYVAYLFASCPGVSKVGSYTGTGTGTTLQVNCGFTAGSRFVMIKRTDSTGAWYVWDSARGIVAGNDPYLLLNSTAAEVTSTDYVDTYSAGFEITSTAPAAINASGGTFIFLAIA